MIDFNPEDWWRWLAIELWRLGYEIAGQANPPCHRRADCAMTSRHSEPSDFSTAYCRTSVPTWWITSAKQLPRVGERIDDWKQRTGIPDVILRK